MVDDDHVVFVGTTRQELVDHAIQGNPAEVCGILAGSKGRVEKVFRIRNTAEQVAAQTGVFRDRATGQPTGGRAAVHYYMDPKDQLRVYNAIDDLDLDVVGYYHSHTHTEARPSPTDVRLAGDLAAVYVLVSLENQPRPDVRAWKILKTDPADETGELKELSVRVDGL